MIIPVHMFAFAKEGDRSQVRPVEIPEEEYQETQDATHVDTIPELLELVFKYGQNDFQSKNFYSVSVGDVAEIDGRYFMCASMGWKEMAKDEFDKLVPPTSSYAYMKSIKDAAKSKPEA